MAKIPAAVAESTVSVILKRFDAVRNHQGKVRDTYKTFVPNELLVYATDRLSIFDFVLPTVVSRKGEYLTGLTHFSLNNILKEYRHHLLCSQAFPSLNAIHDYAFDKHEEFLLKRCLIISQKTVLPFELIFRHHIGGSVYKKYLETGLAGGQKIELGLPKWSKLPEPIFTPSTKEKSGHDINISAQEFFDRVENGREIAEIAKKAYMEAYQYAQKKGVLILDTKMEMASDGTIVDEIFTPDSSRFVTEENWKLSMEKGEEPEFFDKEVVRQWGERVKTPFGVTGINYLDPENPEHLSFVHSLKIPGELIRETCHRYDTIFTTLVGCSLSEYQTQAMGI